jgi:GNAT superfamily N-acetyltransferase
MDTRPIDVHDDAVCARAYEVIVASKDHERPWNEAPSLAETLVEWRHVDQAEPMEMWGAWDGGELVGVATIWLPMSDNTSMVWHDVQVDPAHRRRGAGTALIERIVERRRTSGRADDTREVVERRLDVYDQHTVPLLEYYREREQLIQVNGDRPVDEVTWSVVVQLERAQKSLDG